MAVPLQPGQALLVPVVVIKADDGGNVQMALFDRVVAVSQDDLNNWAIQVDPSASSTSPVVASDSLPPATLVQPANQPTQPAAAASSFPKGTLVQAVAAPPPAIVATPPTAATPGVVKLHPGSIPPASIFHPGKGLKAEWESWQKTQGKKRQ